MALVVIIQSNGEWRREVNLISDDIPGVHVSKGKVETLTPSQLKFSRKKSLKLKWQSKGTFGKICLPSFDDDDGLYFKTMSIKAAKACGVVYKHRHAKRARVIFL